jgi:hypothetical protein
VEEAESLVILLDEGARRVGEAAVAAAGVDVDLEADPVGRGAMFPTLVELRSGDRCSVGVDTGAEFPSMKEDGV